ncbi:MAG: PilZ domain-containing protein [Smithellaceae bacterium]
MPELKIGTTIDIVFENEINKSNAHYMRALVYDYEGYNITISQTSPPLSRHFLNRRIMVTFLANAKKRVLRFGFSARLIDLITDYQISSNKNVEALILKQYDTPEQVDFRMHFRVKPPSQSNLSLFLKEEKINLIDISIGGAKFTYPKSSSFRYGDEVKFKLTIDSTVFEVKARVRNVSLPHEFSANKTLQYVGVEFEHDNKQLETALGRAIIGIERQLLSEGKIN